MAKPKKTKAAKPSKGAKPSAKKKPARPPKPKKQREPYSILIPFLVVLLVLVGIFDLTLAFYIWLNRDKGKPKGISSNSNARTSYVETFEPPSWSAVLPL